MAINETTTDWSLLVADTSSSTFGDRLDYLLIWLADVDISVVEGFLAQDTTIIRSFVRRVLSKSERLADDRNVRFPQTPDVLPKQNAIVLHS